MLQSIDENKVEFRGENIILFWVFSINNKNLSIDQNTKTEIMFVFFSDVKF